MQIILEALLVSQMAMWNIHFAEHRLIIENVAFFQLAIVLSRVNRVKTLRLFRTNYVLII